MIKHSGTGLIVWVKQGRQQCISDENDRLGSRVSRAADLIHEKSQFMDQLFKSWKSCINGIVVDGAANGLKDCDAEA